MSAKRPKPAKTQQNLDRPQTAEPSEQTEQRMLATFESYEGLLPHPNLVRGWEEIEPGSFARILTMAEKDQEIIHERERHPMEMEKCTLEANREFGHRELNLSRNGQIFVFGSVLIFAVGAIYLLATDQDIAGYVALVTALIPTMAALIRQISRRSVGPKRSSRTKMGVHNSIKETQLLAMSSKGANCKLQLRV